MDPTTIVEAASGGSHEAVEILGVMVPIVAIVMGLGVGMLKVWLDFRKKRDILQAHHAERMAAIEKGIELPPLPPEFYGGGDVSLRDSAGTLSQRRQAGLSSLRSGLMWLLIGVAIGVALYADHSNDGAHDAAWWGGVPAAFGLSRLLYFWISNRASAADAAGGKAAGVEAGRQGA
jgi:hypothetical protein